MLTTALCLCFDFKLVHNRFQKINNLILFQMIQFVRANLNITSSPIRFGSWPLYFPANIVAAVIDVRVDVIIFDDLLQAI